MKIKDYNDAIEFFRTNDYQAADGAWSEFYQSEILEPRIMDQASLADDLEPGSLKDEMLKDFDPSQETYEEYLQRKRLGERPFNMAEGGQLVKPSVDGSRPGYGGKEKELTPIMEERISEYNEWAKKNKKPLYNELPRKQSWKKLDIREGTWTGGGKKVDIEIRKFYNDVLNDYNTHVNNLIKEGDINKVKGFKDFTKNYTRPDGKPIKYNIISSWLTDNNKWPLQAQEIKRTIYNNAVNEANKGDKWINKKTLANNIGMKNERELFNFTKYYKNIGGKLNELDSVETKMTRNANKFFSNLNQPVENFFSSISKISEITGIDKSTGSTALKNYNFPIDREIINSLGSSTVQGKVAGMDWRLDDFIDYYNNKSFMEPSTLKQLANVDTTAANIVQDAWRHTLQGGKDIEWIERPKLNKDGEVTSWLDAKFKYVGEDINTPLNQRKIWTVGNQNPDKNIFNIDFVGRDAPEFKNQFKITEDLFNFNNELVKHPVKGTMVKRGELMKEVYHYGTGSGFDRSAYQRDHFDIKKDPFGLKKHKVNGNLMDGLRILPRRINQAAGNIKFWKGYTEKGLGTPVTKLKYAETAGADKYKKIGYNFNKTPAELAASEYEFAKKFFNKFQAAGWNWDGKNWKIKPGMENSANAVLTNEGRIIRKPIDIATDYKKIGKTILEEQDWWKMPPKQQADVFKMAGFNTDDFMKNRRLLIEKAKANAALKTATKGGFLKQVQKICRLAKSSGGRIGFLKGGMGNDTCPLIESDPKRFLNEIVKVDKGMVGKFFKTPQAVKIAKGIARSTLNMANPTTWIGGEAFYVGLEGMNSHSKGVPWNEALDDAFIFYDFEKVDENIMDMASKMNLDESSMALLKNTMNINRLDSDMGKVQSQLEMVESDPLSEIDVGSSHKRIDEIQGQLDNEIQSYVSNVGKLFNQDPSTLSQENLYKGFDILSNVFRKKVLTERQDKYKDIATRADPLAGNLGNWLNTNLFNLDVWKPKYLFTTKLTPEQEEQKYLNEIGSEFIPGTKIPNPKYNPRELYLYNKQRGLTYDDPLVDEALALRTESQPVLGTGWFSGKDYASGGIASLKKKW